MGIGRARALSAVRLSLGYSTTEADLRTYFGAVAPPSQVVLPVDRETGRPRGFAFVEFGSEKDAQAAITELHGKSLDGRTLAVNEAREREPRGGGGGGGGFGGGGGGGGGESHDR